ncbi:hypothetical protein HXX76_012706 [Chlamydomonas incerta]|uniref:Glycosyltransferase family 92 protein n=1 Tax=Chlamydomonas incerta TaxID=51695 RepID=A0A835SUM9_CHLIN|nr:hypothetical protein HXX76_012706 [Chlamydomonas incerta]|eukprot:KAG2426920.1 hypothetical protein HXX76_012706 [Chlamydomonas incerta]
MARSPNKLCSSSGQRCWGNISCWKSCLLFVAVLLAAGGAVAGRLAFHQPGYLAACLLTRDGNHDIREWVEYHLFAGVDKIFVYDHNSSVPVIAEVSDYVASGKVQYTYLSSELPRLAGPEDFPNGFQGRVFAECLEQARGYYKWMMFTDLDEVMYVMHPQYGNSIPAVLKQYEHAGAVLVHRRDVGSSGVQERAPGMGAMTTFTKCVTSNSVMVKGIAQVDYAAVSVNAHCFDYKEGRLGIRLGDNRTVGRSSDIDNPPADPPLLIYHYGGSVAEYTARVATMGTGVSGLTTKSIVMYQKLDSTATQDCLAGRQAHAAMLAANALRPVQPFCTAEGLRRRLARKGRTQKQVAAGAAAGAAGAGSGRRMLR